MHLPFLVVNFFPSLRLKECTPLTAALNKSITEVQWTINISALHHYNTTAVMKLKLADPDLEERILSNQQLHKLEDAGGRSKWDKKTRYTLTCVRNECHVSVQGILYVVFLVKRSDKELNT